MIQIANARSRMAACLLVVALAPACKRAAPASEAVAAAVPATAPTHAQNDKKETSPVDARAPQQAETPPAPDAVMYFIYNEDGDGAQAYEIENGSIASYWYGHAFELDGKRYFTGFAYSTPEKYGKDPEENYPDPAIGVTLAEATFQLDQPGSQKPWRVVTSEPWIGDFGGHEKADEIDESRRAKSYDTRDGVYVLAVPTSTFENGVSSTGYAIFRFHPAELADVEDRHWRYLGTVPTGEDNAAACDGSDVVLCASSTGEITFVPPTKGDLPSIEVRTQSESPGKTEGPAGTTTTRYVYDAAKTAYVER